MANDTTCSACGSSLSPHAPAGNCPRCLLRQVLTETDVRPLIRFFGDYELIAEIAHGGMGIVYRARQISLNRPVALKMILVGHLATPSLVQRFQAEAAAAARLDHPNIIPIFEVGEHDGQHYYAMRLVEGGSLADRIKKEETHTSRGPAPMPKLPGSFSIAQFAKIARAVHHAHQRGVLHRDLKPTNIVLDVDGEPHVSDFGLAKILEDNLDLTQSMAVLGTPAYMAPEQAAGHSKHLTTAADVYSLGAILYELLTGQPPFREETALATLRKVAEQSPTPPRAVNPQVDRSLETICLKCLEKQPTQRYSSAEALAEDLDRWERGEPLLAQPVSQTERVWRWCQRKPALASVLAILFLVFFAAFAVVTRQWQRAETHAAREKLQHERAQSFATRMAIEKANSLFEQDRAADALGYLAQLLRQTPANRVVAERIISALSQRSFCLPVAALRHAGPINTVRLSPDGRRVLTASDDKTARIWDAETGQLLREIQHGDAIESAQFSSDGLRIVTASRDRTAQVWDSQSGKPITPPLKHDGEVHAADFSASNDRVVTASADHTVRVWDAVSGTALIAPLTHGSNAVMARFSPDGERLVTASKDKLVRVWNARTGRILATLRNRWEADEAQFTPDGTNVLVGSADLFDAATGESRGRQFALHTPRIYSVRFSPDGRKAITASADSTARIWDLTSGTPLTGALRHDSRVYAAEFGPHGLTVVTSSKDRAVRVWDALSGQPLSEPLWHDSEVRFAQLSATGHRVVTLPAGEVAWLWDLRILQPPNQIFAHGEAVRSACFSRDGRQVLTASWDHTARLWDVESGQLVIQPFQHRSWVSAARFSPDGAKIVTASHDGTARVWDAQTGESLAKLSHQDVVNAAEFSPDSRWVVTASEDGTAQVWEAGTDPASHNALHHDAAVHSARFSPDGKRILTASSDGTARVWKVSSGLELVLTLPHPQPVQNARFSPDGRWVVTVSLDGNARVWDATSGRLMGAPVHHDDEFDASSPQFNPAGTKVITASRNSARIWNLLTGQPLTEPLLHSERVTSVQFDPTGRYVVTTSKDQSARLWDAASGLPLSEAMLHTNGVISAEFSADGRWLITSSYEGLARLWEISLLPGFPRAWLAELAEAVGGKEYDQQSFAKHVPLQKLVQLREQLLAVPSSDSYSRWAKWFFSESTVRTISPSSSVTVNDYVQQRMQDKNVEGPRRAAQLAPTNGVALARLAMALFNPATNRNEADDAQWYATRAVEVSPEAVETWLTRAKLLERESKGGPALDVMLEAARHLPHHPAIWNAQGLLLLRANRLEEAYGAFSKAISLTQGGTNLPNVRARALASRAEVLRASNRPEEAHVDFLEAKRIPPRDSQTPATMIDLTPHFNGGLSENWRGLYDRDDLAALPPGPLESGGLTFDVRGVVQLAARGLRRHGRKFPQRVEGIHLGRLCQRLHFLHAAGYLPGATNGACLAHYTVHYANGTKLDIPLTYGRDVSLHWVRSLPDNSGDEPIIGWRGRADPTNAPAAGLFPVLYRTTWTNPLPSVPIVSLDLVSAMVEVDYFLAAITTE